MPLTSYKYHFDKELTNLPTKLVQRIKKYEWETNEDICNKLEFFRSFEIIKVHNYNPLLLVIYEVKIFSQRCEREVRYDYVFYDGNRVVNVIEDKSPNNLHKFIKYVLKDWLKKVMNVKD
jgi:hypothetical protein